MSQRIAILAILVAASAVPAFDYAITRVGDDIRAGASHRLTPSRQARRLPHIATAC